MSLISVSQIIAPRNRKLNTNKAVKSYHRYSRNKARKLLSVIPSERIFVPKERSSLPTEEKAGLYIPGMEFSNGVAHQPPLLKSAISAMSALAVLLEEPLLFVPATKLTLDTETTQRRMRKSLRIINAEHLKRRHLTKDIAKSWPSASKHPRLGLNNPHNLCYRRSVTQSLLNTPIFMNWVASLKRRHHSKDGNLRCPQGGCVACTLSELSDAVWTKSQPRVDITLRQFDRIIRTLGTSDYNRSWMITSWEQADAHDFLATLLDILRYNPSYNNPSSIAHGLFTLTMGQEWICNDCGHVQTRGSFIDEIGITAALVDEDKVPYPSPIAAAFTDTLEVTCEMCKSTGARAARYYVEAAPEILFVHFKRFSWSIKGRALKDCRPVVVPETLDLGQYVRDPAINRWERTLHYKLSSVVAHRGTLTNGHYITYSVGPGSNYHVFSDTSVQACTREQMLKGHNGFTPYILTYINDTSMAGSIDHVDK